MTFFHFSGLAFLERKEKSLLYIDALLHILLLKVKQMFKNAFMITRLKYSHEGLNIVVILSIAREFSYAKYAELPLIFTE